MTKELFREDGYLRECAAQVVEVIENVVILDRTVFYPMGGGQPGDTGKLVAADGTEIKVVDTRKDAEAAKHLHVLDDAETAPAVGDKVTAIIDWERRYRIMRMHSCMHMLSVALPFGVTGGQIREDSARLDFDMPDPPDKDKVNEDLRKLIEADYPMSLSWITDAELDAKPELVKTMSVQPPRGAGKIRLVNFEGADLQPCGGTHVKSSAEIGAVRVRKIEKKGKRNRRVNIEFVE